jgi:hypothetical protein
MNNTGKILVFGFACLSTLPAFAIDHHKYVQESKVISAPLKTVWQAVKAQKTNDPEHRRVISTNGTVSVVEEKFSHIPVLGTVTCQYSQAEIAGNKLEYKMISSDKFVAFEGEWELKQLADGQTSVTLSSFVDSGLKLPFADKITRSNTKRSVTARLSEIEQWVNSDKKSRLAAK